MLYVMYLVEIKCRDKFSWKVSDECCTVRCIDRYTQEKKKKRRRETFGNRTKNDWMSAISLSLSVVRPVVTMASGGRRSSSSSSTAAWSSARWLVCLIWRILFLFPSFSLFFLGCAWKWRPLLGLLRFDETNSPNFSTIVLYTFQDACDVNKLDNAARASIDARHSFRSTFHLLCSFLLDKISSFNISSCQLNPFFVSKLKFLR